MMKLMIRVSVVTLVFAGALASSLTPKTHANAAVSQNTMLISSALPIPSCEPGKTGCGIP